MTTRVAVNGFGRIGRQILRRILSGPPGVDPIAINSLRGSPEVLAHLLTYDTVFGRWPGEVSSDSTSLIVDGRRIWVLHVADPSELPWAALEIDVVAEATGAFADRSSAALHLKAGARKVVVTSLARDADITVVVGVNDDRFDPAIHSVVSGASCTTNCLAPMAMVLHQRFGIVGGLMTTIHAYTRDQELIDGIHHDLRRARAAAHNIVPTKTGAARAIRDVLPELTGKFVGIAVRVPIPDVSLVDLSVTLEQPATTEDINDSFRMAASCPRLTAIIGISDEPLVSSDFLGDTRSCVIDAASTRGGPANQFKVLAWYDNEAAYAARMVDLMGIIAAEPARDLAPLAAFKRSS
ncbi:MAG: type I glyceraldehyde-3-phosphate dehydrogenase [Actinomycetota bacterium]